MPSKMGIYIFILIGLLVGLTLDTLIRWEVKTPFYYAFTVVFGYLYALSYNEKNNQRLMISSFFVTLFLTIPFIGFKWAGFGNDHTIHMVTFWMIFPTFAYVAHCFHYAYHQDNTFDVSYVSLFAAVWNSIILILIAIVFSTIAHSLIMLGGFIFKTTGNDLLWDFVNNNHFSLIMNTVLIFIGLNIGQQNLNIIYSIRFLLLKVMYYLFPILAVISTLYLILHLLQVLTGGIAPINPLFILVPLSILGIVFFNAFYQDGDAEVAVPAGLQLFYKIYRVVLFIIVLMMTYHLFKQNPINSNVLIVILCGILFSATYAITAYFDEVAEKKWIRLGNIGTAIFFLIALFIFNIPYANVDFTLGSDTPVPYSQKQLAY